MCTVLPHLNITDVQVKSVGIYPSFGAPQAHYFVFWHQLRTRSRRKASNINNRTEQINQNA